MISDITSFIHQAGLYFTQRFFGALLFYLFHFPFELRFVVCRGYAGLSVCGQPYTVDSFFGALVTLADQITPTTIRANDALAEAKAPSDSVDNNIIEVMTHPGADFCRIVMPLLLLCVEHSPAKFVS
jgi:hypothetical protein